MRKIYGMWFVRRVLPTLSVEAGLLVVIAVGAQGFIKWGHIVNNVLWRLSHHPVEKLGHFWLAALANTELATIMLGAGACVAAAFFVRDARRTMRNFLLHSRVTF